MGQITVAVLLTILQCGICAFINRLRGAGGLQWGPNPTVNFTPIPGTRIYASLLWGVFSAIRLHPATVAWLGGDFVACSVLFFLWADFGWAQYFSSFSGIWKPTEGHVQPITWLGLKIWPLAIDGASSTPSPATAAQNRERGTFCMMLRGMFILGWFAYLGWRLHQEALFLALGAASGIVMGLIYRYASKLARWFGNGDAIATAELLEGFAVRALAAF